MKRQALVFLFILIFLTGWSQTPPKVLDQSGTTMAMPWAGGMNSIQFGSIDLNGDGVNDLVAFDRQGNRLMCFLNKGEAGKIQYTYAPEYAQYFPPIYSWVKFRDYDHDGKTDLFTYSPGWAGILVFKNVSKGSTVGFKQMVHPYLTTLTNGGRVNLYVTYADYPGIVDLEGDGDLDILSFWGLGSFVELHKNRSMDDYGTPDSLDFQKTEYCWGHFAESDESNALYLDSCVSNSYKNSPSSQQITQKKRHTGSTFLMLDLNADSIQDLLLGDVDYPGLVALYNGGTRQTAHITSFDTLFPDSNEVLRLYSMPAAAYIDVNNDGVKDLLVSPFDPGLYVSQNKHSVWLYLNEGKNNLPKFRLQSKNFLQDQMIDAGSGAYPVFIDWDKDGKTDLMLGNYGFYQSSYYDHFILHSIYESRLCYYKNTGTQQQPQFTLVDSNFAQMAQYHYLALYPTFGDLNGDGTTDLLVGNAKGNLIFMRNNGANQFVLADSNYLNIQTTGFSAPVLFDLDKDGLDDLIIGQKGGTLTYYHNNGTPQQPDFKWVTDSLGKINVTNFQLSYTGYSTPDFFRDSTGTTYLLVGSEEGKVYEYTGIDGRLDQPFTPSHHFDSLFHIQIENKPAGIRTAVALADLNGNRKPELLLGNFSGGLEYFQTNDNPSGILPITPQSTNRIRLFPNPAKKQLQYQMTRKLKVDQIKLFDYRGRCVYQEQLHRTIQSGSLSLPKLPHGIYLFVVNSRHQHYGASLLIQQ